MSTAVVPRARPEAEASAVRGWLGEVDEAVAVVGRRGYYRDTMGTTGKNDRGIYDDALFVVTPQQVTAFNANTDPSISHPHVATLQVGKWRYKPGVHGLNKPPEKRYPAFVQAAEVWVQREGGPPESGLFGINHHRGSWLGTSSEGCQTLYPEQWEEYYNTLMAAMRAHGQTKFWYVLTAREDT